MSRLAQLHAESGALRRASTSHTLREVLEAEVIPRLALRHAGEEALDPDLVLRLMRCVCEADLAGARALLEGREVDFEQLVTATARRLGEDWDLDRRSFADVTLGLSTLSMLVEGGSDVTSPSRGLVLLTTAPGEQHALGLGLVALRLRADGWLVSLEPGLPVSDVCARLRASRHDAVGFSVSRRRLLPGLGACLEALHQLDFGAGARPTVFIGGPLPLSDLARSHGVLHFATPADAARALRRRVRPG